MADDATPIAIILPATLITRDFAMRISPRFMFAALLVCLPLLGCGNSDPAPAADPASGPTTLLGKAVKGATDQARQELAKENIDLSATGYPRVEITPTGDFLIEGKAVMVNAEQKALLTEYHGHITKVAEAGIGIGLEGADLAGKAVTEAIKGVFTGNSDQIDKKIEAEAKGIEQSAQKLCDLLPAMKATQDKLAVALPEFKPYASMDQSDIDNCMTENGNSDMQREAIRGEIRAGIREGIRETVRGTTDTGGGVASDAAAEAEAATVNK